LHARTNLAAAG